MLDEASPQVVEPFFFFLVPRPSGKPANLATSSRDSGQVSEPEEHVCPPSCCMNSSAPPGSSFPFPFCNGLAESNFRLEREPQQYAAELFGNLRARMVSRFQRLGGFMPGLSIVASSAGEESCFTEQLIWEIEKRYSNS